MDYKNNINEGVAKNNPKIEKYINELNFLILSFKDEIGDPIGVVDSTGTWEEPYIYLPIQYKNGFIRIKYYSEYDQKKVIDDIIKPSNVPTDGVDTIKAIKRMYTNAIRKHKLENNKITEGVKHIDVNSIVENVVNRVLKEQTEKRYVAVVDFYVYAKDDNEAMQKAKGMCDSFDGDSECSVVKLVEQPFGTTNSRVIFGEE